MSGPVIIEDVDQGTPAWDLLRLGIPTASEYGNLITPSKLAPSTQADAYLHALTAEWITGRPSDAFVSFWMDRGTALEPEAREAYSFETGLAVTQVGFVYKDEERMTGCSPDGLTMQGDIYRKGQEIKCPKPNNHVAYRLAGECPKKYYPQVQGSMWNADLDEWDFVSYHPRFPLFIVTVERDVKWMAALDEIVPAFIERVKKARESELAIEMREIRIAQEQADGGMDYEWG